MYAVGTISQSFRPAVNSTLVCLVFQRTPEREMIMSKMKWNRSLAGVFVACAFGGLAIGIAWATPGAGVVITTLLAGPVPIDEVDIKGETDTHELELKTKGVWEYRAVHFNMAPGAHTGWHSHPGPAFVMIKSGALTLEQSDGSIAVYPAGTRFVEKPGRVHIARNEGDVNLEFDAFLLTPQGAPVRIDEPEPTAVSHEDEDDEDDEDDD